LNKRLLIKARCIFFYIVVIVADCVVIFVPIVFFVEESKRTLFYPLLPVGEETNSDVAGRFPADSLSTGTHVQAEGLIQ